MIAIFPEIVTTAAKADVESLAVLVRRYFGGEQKFAPKLRMAPLIESAGVSLRSLGLGAMGALLAKDERGTFSIVMIVNQQLGAAEAQFMMAHLLGHYLLEVQPVIARGDWQVSGHQETGCALARYAKGGSSSSAPANDSKREALADGFAAALLLPRAMVTRAMESLQDTAKVAAFFGVTRACLQRRLIDIGMVADTPVNFFDAEHKAGIAEPAVETAVPNVTEAQLVPPEGTMPRAYAASTYGSTEKMTRTVAKVETAVSTSTPAPSRLGGMERLREIARKLDKGAPDAS